MPWAESTAEAAWKYWAKSKEGRREGFLRKSTGKEVGEEKILHDVTLDIQTTAENLFGPPTYYT